MAKTRNHEILADGIEVPVKVITEWRSSIRMAVGKDSLILRIPPLLTKHVLRKQLDFAKIWLEDQFAKNPRLKSRFTGKEYKAGHEMTINGDKYILFIQNIPSNTSYAEIKRNSIVISMSEQLRGPRRNKVISKLISRFLAKKYLPAIEKRIRELNDKYFEKKINRIRLKNNYSNWGSCSAKGNINISTRLLFAPPSVQDYVFIHELTHLVHMNHSRDFWQLIENIDPDYSEKEKWLKENSHRQFY